MACSRLWHSSLLEVNILTKPYKVSFNESLFTRWTYLQHSHFGHPRPSLLEWGNVEISKTACKKVKISSPLNIVSNGQITFKKRIPANASNDFASSDLCSLQKLAFCKWPTPRGAIPKRHEITLTDLFLDWSQLVESPAYLNSSSWDFSHCQKISKDTFFSSAPDQ